MTGRRWSWKHPVIYLWLPTLAWMALIFYLSAQPDLPHPTRGWAELFVSSAAHMVTFAVLAVLWLRTLGGHPRARLLALILTFLYAISDEVHQAFVPGRTPDLLDLLCDGAGAMIALWVWTRVRHRPRA
jgi:VanZ family protein